MDKTKLLYEEESYLIRGACFSVYKQLRNTQKESVYQRALLIELQNMNLLVEREKRFPIFYNGKQVGFYTPDLVVNNAILLELKAKTILIKEDVQQFWYYLKNTGFQLGFLINFGESDGVKIVRRVYESSRPNASA